MKVFTVDIPMLKVTPLFVLDCTYDELGVYLRRRFRVTIDRTPEAMAGVMLTFQRPPWRVVWTRRLDLPVALHEVFHLVTAICDARGITIRAHNERGENDDETAAYLFELIARAVIKRCH